MQCASKTHDSRSNAYSTEEAIDEYYAMPEVAIKIVVNSCHVAEFENYILGKQNDELFKIYPKWLKNT